MLPTIGCQQYTIAASGSNATDHWLPTIYHCRQWIQCYRPLATNNIPLPQVDPMLPTIGCQQYTIAASGSNATNHWLPTIYHCRQWIQCYRPLAANNIPLPPVDPMLPTIGCQQYTIAASGSNATDHWLPTIYHCHKWIQCYRPLAANNIPLPPVDPMLPTISYKQYTIATSGSNATDHWLPTIYNCRQWIQCYRPLAANNIPLPPVDPMLPTIGCQQYAIAASGSNVTDHTDSLQRGQNYQREKVT